MLRMYACVNLFGLGFLPVAASWFSAGQGVEPIYTAFTDTLTLSARTPCLGSKCSSVRITQQEMFMIWSRDTYLAVSDCPAWDILKFLRHGIAIDDMCNLQKLWISNACLWRNESAIKGKARQVQTATTFFSAAVCLSDFLESRVSNFRGKHCHWISTYTVCIYIYIFYIYIHVMIMIEYLPTILSLLCLISCLSGQTLDFDGFGVPQSSLVNSSCNLLNKPQQAAVINWEAPCQLPPITLLGFEI